jgi:hypothetical protein
MMKKLTALILSAAIVPLLAMGTSAIADEHDDMQADTGQHADEQGVEKEVAEEEAAEKEAADEQAADEQGAGKEAADKQGAEKEAADEQGAEKQDAGKQGGDEQPMSAKPAGAFHADDVIGKTLKRRQSDEDVGEIQDLIIGEDNRIVGVVVKTSGFLGRGGQHTGLGWDRVEHTIDDDEHVFYTDIDEETLKNLPEYKRD